MSTDSEIVFDVNESLKNIRDAREVLADMYSNILELLDCDDCVKGPCIGRLEPGEVCFATKQSLFLYNGKFYLRGCAMARRQPSPSLPIKITNNDGVFRVDAPALEIKIESRVLPKDISIE